MSFQSSHHPQEVILAQFSLYDHKGGLKPDSFHFFHAHFSGRLTFYLRNCIYNLISGKSVSTRLQCIGYRFLNYLTEKMLDASVYNVS